MAARKLYQAVLASKIDMVGRLILGMQDFLPVMNDLNGLQMTDLTLNRIRVAGMWMAQALKAETLPCLHQDPTFLITLIELL